MKIKVTRHVGGMGATDNIDHINIVKETDDVIILHIELKTKHAKICDGGGDVGDGGGDDGVHWFWIGGDQIEVTLPTGFYHSFYDSCRYTGWICIFKHELIENMPMVWQRPEQKTELDDTET